MFAMVDLSNPVVIAVIIGWILSVVLHELAHGLVASAGGDYTIKDRGGLTLNPFQYIDPMISIVYPLIAMALGGVPLSGGVTFVRTDLLRSRVWATAVSLAGPAMNFLLFFLLVMPFHPRVGWIHPTTGPDGWTAPQLFLATLAMLQFYAACFNLLPIPPLDGFQAIAPYLEPQLRQKLLSPAAAQAGFLVVFLIAWNVPALQHAIMNLVYKSMVFIGFDRELAADLYNALPKTIANR